MKVLSANSYYNGISFKNEKHYSKAIVQKNGTIRLVDSNTIFSTFYEKFVIWYYIISSISFITYSIIHVKDIEFIVGSLVFCIYFYINIISIFSGILMSIFKPDFRKYHSAEHKIVNFLLKNDKIPTLEDVRDESRFCTTCQSTEALLKTFLGIIWIVLMFSSINLLYKILIFFVTYAILYFLYSIDTFIFLQFIITSKKCTDQHIKVGLEALKNLEQ